jgi:hypothetical protein
LGLPFAREVADAFGDSLKNGTLKWNSSRQDDSHFGNALVDMSGGNFALRVVRDRGDISVEVSSRSVPDNWLPLEWILAVLDETPIRPPRATSVLNAAAKFASNAERLDAAMGPGTFPIIEATIEDQLAAIDQDEWFGSPPYQRRGDEPG